MPVPQITNVNGQWATYSWTRGYQSAAKDRPIEQEARKNPEAVINRLMNQERWEEAERILDAYV